MEIGRNLIQQDEQILKKFVDSFPAMPSESRVPVLLFKILQASSVFLANEEVLIYCPTWQNAHALFLRKKYFLKVAAEVRASRITFTSLQDGPLGKYYKRSAKVQSILASTIMPQNLPKTSQDSRILTISEWDLKQELCQFQGAGGAKVIRVFDNQSIDCAGNVEKSSGVKSNDWLRLDHASLWIPEEFSNFKSELISKVELRNYSYVAHLADLQKCRFVVDARLAFYRGDLVRIVKVHNCDPI